MAQRRAEQQHSESLTGNKMSRDVGEVVVDILDFFFLLYRSLARSLASSRSLSLASSRSLSLASSRSLSLASSRSLAETVLRFSKCLSNAYRLRKQSGSPSRTGGRRFQGRARVGRALVSAEASKRFFRGASKRVPARTTTQHSHFFSLPRRFSVDSLILRPALRLLAPESPSCARCDHLHSALAFAGSLVSGGRPAR